MSGNPGWQQARQAPYPLWCLSSPLSLCEAHPVGCSVPTLQHVWGHNYCEGLLPSPAQTKPSPLYPWSFHGAGRPEMVPVSPKPCRALEATLPPRGQHWGCQLGCWEQPFCSCSPALSFPFGGPGREHSGQSQTLCVQDIVWVPDATRHTHTPPACRNGPTGP